jgi:urease accessory protein
VGGAIAEPNQVYCCWVSLRYTHPTRILIFGFDIVLAWFYFLHVFSPPGGLFIIPGISCTANLILRNTKVASKITGISHWTGLGLSSIVKLVIVISALLGMAFPVYAHHPSGGEISTTFLEGFLSGLGHPIIGFDHLIFVISVGLLASAVARGFWVPVVFVSTALAGTWLHLMLVDMPMVEVIISASVLVFGILLAKLEKPKTAIVAVLAGVAGLFHGYAYGEAIIGATAAPLAAYLLGFTLMQASISLIAFKVAMVVKESSVSNPNFLRFAGYIAIGSGMAFLAASF